VGFVYIRVTSYSFADGSICTVDIRVQIT
jgi:hypothetical protein